MNVAVAVDVDGEDALAVPLTRDDLFVKRFGPVVLVEDAVGGDLRSRAQRYPQDRDDPRAAHRGNTTGGLLRASVKSAHSCCGAAPAGQ